MRYVNMVTEWEHDIYIDCREDIDFLYFEIEHQWTIRSLISEGEWHANL